MLKLKDGKGSLWICFTTRPPQPECWNEKVLRNYSVMTDKASAGVEKIVKTTTYFAHKVPDYRSFCPLYWLHPACSGREASSQFS